MNVAELIERLQEYDDQMEVVFSYDYGDHCHMQAAPEIRNVDEQYIVRSDYLRMDKVVEDVSNSARLAVVIS